MKKDILYINGKTEDEIVNQILEEFNNNKDKKELEKVLKDYEESNGLYELKENMSKYFEKVI